MREVRRRGQKPIDGRLVTHAREMLGMSPAEFAAKVGVGGKTPADHLRRMECGSYPVSAKIERQVKEILGMK